MFLQIAQAASGHIARHREAKNRAAWTRYNNAMVNIQAGQARNAITDNVAMQRAAKAENDMLIQTSRLVASAQVRAGAAAAGVSGGSVDATLYDLNRNAARKQQTKDTQFERSIMVTNQQRRTVAMQTAMSQRQAPAMPSLLQTALTTGLSIWEERQEAPGSAGTMLESGVPAAAPETEEEGSIPFWDRLRSQLMI